MRIYELMEDDRHYYIISELLSGGELYDRILHIKRFGEQDAAHLIHQLLLALNYMHQKNIIHRDIKPENVLFRSADPSDMTIKLTDFGFAQFLNPENGGLSDTLGSPLYMAPEIVKKVKYDTKIDIWSLGVMAYIMVSGRPPFNGKSKEEIFLQLTTQPINYLDGQWGKISKGCKTFIKKCLTRDKRFRPTAQELLQDEWIVNNIQSFKITTETILDITSNLQSFRKYSVF